MFYRACSLLKALRMEFEEMDTLMNKKYMVVKALILVQENLPIGLAIQRIELAVQSWRNYMKRP